MIIRPIPFPEELDRSYLGRVKRLNGVGSETEVVKLMASWAGVAGKSRREVSPLELLSKVAGTELSRFVWQQTTLPFRRAITSYQPDLAHGSNASRSMLWTSGMRLARTAAFFCPVCVQEDQDFHGQSYWRRGHQLPGVLSCPKHDVPLKYIDDGAAFLSPPSQYLSIAQKVDPIWAAEVSKNEVIQRFLEISAGLIDRSSPLEVKSVSAILKTQAMTLGYQTHGGAIKAPLLSDAVVRAYGRKWLGTVFPALADKQDGVLLSQMDGVLYLNKSASSVVAYVLASTLLFESADSALNALQSEVNVSRHHRCSLNIAPDQLIRAYVEGRGNHSVVASLLSVSRPAITARLLAVGLPNLNETSKQNSFAAARAFFIEKQTLSQSAAKGKISVEDMEELMRNAGGGLSDALRTMSRPSGRGSGKRRAKQLTPDEVTKVNGAMAIKFSPNIRREQLRNSQVEDMEVPNVAK